MSTKINYGIDAPGVIRNLFIIGLVLFIGGFFPIKVKTSAITFPLNIFLLVWGAIFLTQATLMLLYAKKGKFHHRDRMLELVKWRGDETVLDVGTGLGLLMIGAAKKLSSGKSTGIDIWNTEDLSNNKPGKTKQNIDAEQVGDKTEVFSMNITATTFPDKSFDVVLSNLCLHNIHSSDGREKACEEIYRLLKNDGTAVISDFRHMVKYGAAFTKLGMTVRKTGTFYFDTFPPLTIIVAKKI